MKTLCVFTVGKDGNGCFSEEKTRSKLCLNDTENRPEYIEIDNSDFEKDEPIVRISFADNKHWVGTMEELKSKLGL